jgi:hypothetical protein
MQGEKTTCLPCLNTKVLLLQTLALDLLKLVARLKLSRCLRAHKKTFNKQNNTPSMKNLKRQQGLALGKRTPGTLGTIERFGRSQTRASYAFVSFNYVKSCA